MYIHTGISTRLCEFKSHIPSSNRAKTLVGLKSQRYDFVNWRNYCSADFNSHKVSKAQKLIKGRLVFQENRHFLAENCEKIAEGSDHTYSIEPRFNYLLHCAAATKESVVQDLCKNCCQI
jgi:hypothetical protein